MESYSTATEVSQALDANKKELQSLRQGLKTDKSEPERWKQAIGDLGARVQQLKLQQQSVLAQEIILAQKSATAAHKLTETRNKQSTVTKLKEVLTRLTRLPERIRKDKPADSLVELLSLEELWRKIVEGAWEEQFQVSPCALHIMEVLTAARTDVIKRTLQSVAELIRFELAPVRAQITWPEPGYSLKKAMDGLELWPQIQKWLARWICELLKNILTGPIATGFDATTPQRSKDKGVFQLKFVGTSQPLNGQLQTRFKAVEAFIGFIKRSLAVAIDLGEVEETLWREIWCGVGPDEGSGELKWAANLPEPPTKSLGGLQTFIVEALHDALPNTLIELPLYPKLTLGPLREFVMFLLEQKILSPAIETDFSATAVARWTELKHTFNDSISMPSSLKEYYNGAIPFVERADVGRWPLIDQFLWTLMTEYAAKRRASFLDAARKIIVGNNYTLKSPSEWSISTAVRAPPPVDTVAEPTATKSSLSQRVASVFSGIQRQASISFSDRALGISRASEALVTLLYEVLEERNVAHRWYKVARARLESDTTITSEHDWLFCEPGLSEPLAIAFWDNRLLQGLQHYQDAMIRVLRDIVCFYIALHEPSALREDRAEGAGAEVTSVAWIGDRIGQTPTIGAMFHNDCYFIASHLAHMNTAINLQVIAERGNAIGSQATKGDEVLCVVDLAVPLESLGQTVLARHLVGRRREVEVHLDGCMSLSMPQALDRMEIPTQSQAVEQCLKLCMLTIARTVRSWKDVLPTSTLRVLCARLLDIVCSRVLIQVEMLTDISMKSGSRLWELLDLVRVYPLPITLNRDTEVSSWPKFVLLQGLLHPDHSLAKLTEELKANKYTSFFAVKELVSLVQALYQPSKVREATVALAISTLRPSSQFQK